VLGTSIVSFKQRGDRYKTRYLSINRAAQSTSQSVRVMSLVRCGSGSHMIEKKKRKAGSVPVDRNRCGGMMREMWDSEQ
jgi:hypothetical protein